MPASELNIKQEIMDEKGLDRTLSRLAHEIIESSRGVENLVMVGILTRGFNLAKRLAEKIEHIEDRKTPVGALDITLYRDDMSYNQQGILRRMKKPRLQTTDLPFDLDDKIVILVDDVIYTGRTIRAALNALMDFGRPEAIRLVVMIDRGHRQLPVRADFIGKELTTSEGEEVRVQLKSVDGVDRVLLVGVSK